MTKVTIGAVLLAFAAGCSSSSSGSGACMFTATSNGTVTMVNAASGNDPTCPAITPAQLNAGDGGSGGCAPQVDTSKCTATYNCMTGGVTITGSAAATGGSFTAAITASISEDGGALTCSYTLTGTVP